jgi:hypothetical protein
MLAEALFGSEVLFWLVVAVLVLGAVYLIRRL